MRAVVVAIAAVLVAGGADEVAAKIDAAKAAHKKKDAIGTVSALEAALVAARAEAPLEVRRAVVVHEPHTGLGLFTPAFGDEVVGRDMRLYVEVANYAAVAAPDGVNVALDVEGDFTFHDPGEKGAPPEDVALGTVKLGTQQFFTRTNTGLTSFGLDVHLGAKSPAGVYAMKLRVTDKNAPTKTATRDLRFVLK